MKSVILALAALISFSLNAQVPKRYPQKGEYVENPELEKLAGTWQGVRGNDTFTIVLQFRKKRALPPIFVDGLSGWHQYREGGMIESTTFPMIGIDTGASISGSELETADLYKGITMGFSDHNRSKNLVVVSFKLVPGTMGQAIWEVLPGDWSEGEYQTLFNGVKRKVPPPSKIVTIREWHLTKIN